MTSVISSFRCCVDNCNSISSSNQQLTFFSFPKNRTRCKTWLDNIPKIFIDKHRPVSTNDLKVCSKHFKQDMFCNSSENVLMANAVPTIFKDIDDNAEETIDYFKIDIDEHNPFAQDTIPKVEKEEPCQHRATQNHMETQTNNFRTYGNKIIHRNKETQTGSHQTEAENDLIKFKVKDFYKICRICFTDDVTIFIDIFNAKCKEATFLSILDKNNDTEESQNLPRFICENCTEDMLKYHYFRQKIVKSTSILTGIHKTLTEGQIMNVNCLSEILSSELTLQDCEYQSYIDLIKDQPLQAMGLFRITNKSGNNVSTLNENETVGIDYTNPNETVGIDYTNPNETVGIDYTNPSEAESLEHSEKVGNESMATKATAKSRPNGRKRIKYTEEEELQRRTCSTCNKVYASTKCLYDHKRRKHSNVTKPSKYTEEDQPQRRTCPICNKVYSSRQTLFRHKSRKHSNKPKPPKVPKPPPRYTEEEQLQRRTCPICNKVCATRMALWGHKSTAHVLAKCEICHVEMRKYRIKPHMRNIHKMVTCKKYGRTKVLCTKCGKHINGAKYKDHLRIHLGIKLACDLCDFRTKYSSSLHQHKKLHGEPQFLCATCGKGCFTKNYLDFHVATHKILDEPIMCKFCPDKFQTKFDYEIHRRDKHKHQTDKRFRKATFSTGPHTCPICQKEFNTYMTFYNHKQSHSTRRLLCKICEKPYKSRLTLKVHMRMHTGEKPYKCEVCDKSFAQLPHLKSHVTSLHTNEKAWKCLICDKGFNLKHSLREHLRSHTGERLKCKH